MESVVLKPEKEYKSVEFIVWGIILIIVSVFLMTMIIFIPDIEAKIIFSVLISVFWLVMVFIALWIPAYFKTLEYSINKEAVKMNRGVFWKRRITVPYHKITNVDVSQGPLERKYDFGTIHVQTAGAGGTQGAKAELRMSGVRELERFKDIIMERVKGHQSFERTFISSQPEKKTVDISSSEILQSILTELKAIRKVLKKKR
ncbi:MAG TPA: PH domain-containing protein [bacterium]|nr:PH domain-containing protein [bacterium]